MSEYGDRYPGKLTRPADQSERQAGQDWINKPHEKLVNAFQEFISKKKQDIPYSITSSRLIQEELNMQANFNTKEKPDKVQFYRPLYHAWNVISHQLQKPNEMPAAIDSLARFYNAAVARNETRPEVIKLSHPLQIKILDALADAVGIPYAKGQREIEIPEKLRSFEKWAQSGEYEAAVLRQKTKRGA